MANLSRRNFLKGLAAVSTTAVVPSMLLSANVVQALEPTSLDRKDWSGWKFSGAHWGAFRARVEADKVVEIVPFEFDRYPTDILKGTLDVIYSASRVRYPMVRLDWYKNRQNSNRMERGDNRFVRVSWDEALDLVYEELERIQKDHGPWALHTANVGWRSVGQVHSCGNHMLRAVGMHGRSVGTAGDYSTGAGQMILPYVLGSTEVYSQGTSWDVILEETKLLVLLANDPVKNLQVGWNTETHEAYEYLGQLKQKVADKAIRVISIDPVRTKTQNYLDCEQLYINPMTDVSMLLAIAHTLWKEDLYDKKFIADYTLGFDEFVPYLKGETEDMVEKTPEWAAPICGVPAERIRELARLMVGNRTQIMVGWAIQRQQHGEQPYWMAAIIAAMLGQIGLPGGGISYSHHYSSVGVSSSGASMPGAFPLNLDTGRTPKYDTNDYQGYSSVIPVARMVDALLEPGKEINFNGHKVKLPPFKMAIFTGSNQWHRHQQRNRMKEAYQRLETIVSVDYNWTATCRFADIVLPACTTFERNDIDAYGSYSNRGVIAMHKLVDPLYHSRSDFDIWREFSRRLGREQEYTRSMTEMQWLEKLYEDCRTDNLKKDFFMPPFEEFWKIGYVLFPEGKPWVRHADYREDPEVNALGTPSGFIEIFSRRIARYEYPDCKGHPIWMEKIERSHGGPGSDRYPLWLQSVHPDTRLHSQTCESEERRAEYTVQGREPCYIGPQDAAARGIADGDLVRVYNDRGQLLAGAVISDNFPSGVIRIQEGAWYGPTGPEIGALDTYGDPNTLTLDVGTSDLAQGPSANTCLVEIEKFVGEAPPVTAFGGPIEVHVDGSVVSAA